MLRQHTTAVSSLTAKYFSVIRNAKGNNEVHVFDTANLVDFAHVTEGEMRFINTHIFSGEKIACMLIKRSPVPNSIFINLMCIVSFLNSSNFEPCVACAATAFSG